MTTADDFTQLGLTEWQVSGDTAEASYECGSFTAGGALVARIAAIADGQNHHPDLSLGYPGVVKGLAKLPDDTVLDGEVVAFDEEGRPSFSALQNYGAGAGPVGGGGTTSTAHSRSSSRRASSSISTRASTGSRRFIAKSGRASSSSTSPRNPRSH